MQKSETIGFFVDLPMVFSVVSLKDLIKAANSYYNTNIVAPTQGSFVEKLTSSGDEKDELKPLYLYEIIVKRSTSMANIGLSESKIVRVGEYKSIYEVLNSAKTTTIFQDVKEADIFLNAMLKFDKDLLEARAFVVVPSEIEGILE
ncbi:hypothetical protein BKH43_03570 [Helicobacter sp. 13S00401-1]|uniref:hypothetical protein n=1 Tax=Helicobacter sp. 13S00401-1 TaxID=1905758 RepID=UPI000BA72730|nr:hypothetical protein [Helicobacter sp. 13S00401-1]PAF50946.1 hypothetical protein BKH43_03570 [Helicobacter sp. 13S00401-1]